MFWYTLYTQRLKGFHHQTDIRTRKEKEEEKISDHESKHSRNNTCTSIPANLVGRLKVNLTSPSWEELETKPGFTRLRPGGEFSPTDCDSEYSGEFAKHG